MPLVVLAAGIGSRFGGIKQLPPLTDDGEYILSEALKQMLMDGVKVKVLDTDDEWCGVTYKEDSDLFREFIRMKKASGEYPAILWKDNQ